MVRFAKTAGVGQLEFQLVLEIRLFLGRAFLQLFTRIFTLEAQSELPQSNKRKSSHGLVIAKG